MISLVTTEKFLSPADNLLLDEIYILFSIKSKPAFFHFHPSKSTTHSLSFRQSFGLQKHANIDTAGLLCVAFRFFVCVYHAGLTQFYGRFIQWKMFHLLTQVSKLLPYIYKCKMLIR